MTHTKASIYLVDENAETRCALHGVLASEGLDVTPFSSPADFLANFKLTHDCCLILDLLAPGKSGEQLIQQLQEWQVSIPIIAITACTDVPGALRAIRIGVLDVCPKPVHLHVLLPLIHHALAVGAVHERYCQQVKAARDLLAGLTSRERQLFDLVVLGQTYKEMGATMGISPRTIEHHRSHMARKLGMDRVAELVRLDITAADGSLTTSMSD